MATGTVSIDVRFAYNTDDLCKRLDCLVDAYNKLEPTAGDDLIHVIYLAIISTVEAFNIVDTRGIDSSNVSKYEIPM